MYKDICWALLQIVYTCTCIYMYYPPTLIPFLKNPATLNDIIILILPIELMYFQSLQRS